MTVAFDMDPYLADEKKLLDNWFATVTFDPPLAPDAPLPSVKDPETKWIKLAISYGIKAGWFSDIEEKYDVSPLGNGNNWLKKVGGLPLFIRAIAHALIRNGHSESNAIQIAIGVCKNWASGKGKVTAKTRAKAAAAIAEWMRKRGESHAKVYNAEATPDDDPEFESLSSHILTEVAKVDLADARNRVTLRARTSRARVQTSQPKTQARVDRGAMLARSAGMREGARKRTRRAALIDRSTKAATTTKKPATQYTPDQQLARGEGYLKNPGAFDASKHPRAAGGKFGSTGTGTTSKAKGGSYSPASDPANNIDTKNPQQVTALQAMLIKLGIPVPADGQFDEKTKEAIAQIQKDGGLPATGIPDPATVQAMRTATQQIGQDSHDASQAAPVVSPGGGKLTQIREDGSAVYSDGSVYASGKFATSSGTTTKD